MNTDSKKTTVKVLLTAALALLLTACKQDYVLLDAKNVIVGNGRLEINANAPSPAHFVVEGKMFTGSWNASKVYEADVAKRHKLLGSRSYQEYMQGNARDQLWRGRATATAQDGTEIVCNFSYRGGQPKSGDCSVGGRHLQLALPDSQEVNHNGQ